MKLSKTELKLIEEMGKGLKSPGRLASAIKKNISQTYSSLKTLEKKGIITRKRNHAGLAEKSFVRLLAKALISNPNLINLLPDSGIKILSLLTAPQSIKGLESMSGLKKSMIYKKVKQAMNISVLKKKKNRYYLNEEIWPELAEMLKAIRLFEETIDSRAPPDAVIYHKNSHEIIYSTTRQQDACTTAFSAYKHYGIRILSPTNYYYLPDKKLSKKEIFTHSLYVAEKTKDFRQLVYTALFYLKYKQSLKIIKHPVLDNIKKILKGEKILNYPDINEIKEKAEQYDIKI